MQDNPLWRYSLAVYDRQGVAPLLIALQDQHHADVNILLCCAWLGSQGEILSPASLEQLVAISSTWREQCVQPLRAVRRFLKGRSGEEAFREQVKALEIDAEQRQQALLYQQWQQMDLARPDTVAINDNLNLYAAYLNSPGTVELSQQLADLAELLK